MSDSLILKFDDSSDSSWLERIVHRGHDIMNINTLLNTSQMIEVIVIIYKSPVSTRIFTHIAEHELHVRKGWEEVSSIKHPLPPEEFCLLLLYKVISTLHIPNLEFSKNVMKKNVSQ